MRADHPCLAKEWTLDLFTSLPHLLVSITGRGGGQVDDALAARGLTRHVAATMPYGLLSPLVVAESDLVLTTSRWLALKLARWAPLVVKRPPIEMNPLVVPMLWHERTHRDARSRWVRRLLVEAARQLEPSLLRNAPEAGALRQNRAAEEAKSSS